MNPKVIKFLAKHFFFEIIAVAAIISFHQVNKGNGSLNAPNFPQDQHDLIEKTPGPTRFDLQYQSMSLTQKGEISPSGY